MFDSSMMENQNKSVNTNYEKMQTYIQQTGIRTQGEVLKKHLQECVRNDNEAIRYMQRADIASKKELQVTKLCFSEDGEIIIHRELFGEDYKGKAPFKIVSANILICLNSEKPRVLLIEFGLNSLTDTVFLSLKNCDSRMINVAFNRAGISFGFSHSKETTMRCELVGCIQKIASVARVPLNHGWYRDGKEIKFAFPESTTWEEVECYVGL